MVDKKIKILVWFRNDLRIHDNPALYDACQKADEILPVYVFDEETPKHWKLGGASKWWLHHSLNALSQKLSEKGANLILRRGIGADQIKALAQEWGADAVYWNRRYEPWGIAHDKGLKADLEQDGVEVQTFNGSLLIEPWKVQTKTGGPYKVFTPFWRMAEPTIEQAIQQPFDVPKQIPTPNQPPQSDNLEDWWLLPSKPNWAGGIAQEWSAGEDTARERLIDFLEHGAGGYKDARDIPSTDGTSRLSPHLAFGEISLRTIWFATKHKMAEGYGGEANYKGYDFFLREIGWREFSYHLLYHFPHTTDAPLNEKFKNFPWHNPDDYNEELTRWQKGQTGIPIVDAGMRQLWQTGWMHNRVRMIVGSLLVKNLVLPWQVGEQWFWDTLVDADLANNTQGWQWIGGCGADASPYFRVFNPVTQGERFDPEGAYVKKYVPELKDMPSKYIHKPWEAEGDLLAHANIKLGETYPKPIVDLKISRQKALDAFAQIKSS